MQYVPVLSFSMQKVESLWQSQGVLHRHDAGVQLRSGDTDHSQHIETALLHWDPFHSWPLQRMAGRCANIPPPHLNF